MHYYYHLQASKFWGRGSDSEEESEEEVTSSEEETSNDEGSSSGSESSDESSSDSSSSDDSEKAKKGGANRYVYEVQFYNQILITSSDIFFASSAGSSWDLLIPSRKTSVV